MRIRLGGLLFGVGILVCALFQAGVPTRLPAPARPVFPGAVRSWACWASSAAEGSLRMSRDARMPGGPGRRRCASSDSTSAD
jgi:hypothetical protein